MFIRERNLLNLVQNGHFVSSVAFRMNFGRFLESRKIAPKFPSVLKIGATIKKLMKIQIVYLKVENVMSMNFFRKAFSFF